MTTADDSPPLPEGRSPTLSDGTVSSFRKRRGRLLARTLVGLAERLGRPVSVLDVGGRRDYWCNVGFEGVGRITLVNYDPADLNRGADPDGRFVDELGDARALAGIGDGQFDFYHSNSVIEHVGGWDDMAAMAREARRVAPHGWVQTPAWEFPVEPHFRLPAMHWLATPAQAALLRHARGYRGLDRWARRQHAERINLLSRSEVRLLFPDTDIRTERVLLLPKSYVVTW